MAVTISGTTGIAGVDGSAGTPAVQGADSNTGVFFPAADTVAIATGGSERARIDSSGRVLIGLTSSAGGTNGAALQVKGLSGSSDFSIALMDSDTTVAGRLHLESTASNSIALQADPDNLGASTYLGFGVDGTERARITSDGDLLVGTTSGTQKLAVLQSHVSNNTASFRNTNASFAGDMVIFGADRNTTNNSFYPINYYNYGASAYKFRVADSGNVTNTNNSYGAISDAKLKENIADATPKLEKLNQVRIVNYNLIGQEQKQLGVIAQELEQVFPGMVEETPDRDADGNDLGTTTKSVKYSVFVPMLIKAVQEQQALIESLTARIAALEGAQA